MPMGPKKMAPLYRAQYEKKEEEKGKGAHSPTTTAKSKSRPEWLKKGKEIIVTKPTVQMKEKEVKVTKPPQEVYSCGATMKGLQKGDDVNTEYYVNQNVDKGKGKKNKVMQLGKEYNPNQEIRAFIEWPIGNPLEIQEKGKRGDKSQGKAKGMGKGADPIIIKTKGKEQLPKSKQTAESGNKQEMESLEDQDMDTSSVIIPEKGGLQAVTRERSPLWMQSPITEEEEEFPLLNMQEEMSAEGENQDDWHQALITMDQDQDQKGQKGKGYQEWSQQWSQQQQQSQAREGGVTMVARHTRVLGQAQHAPTGYTMAVAYDTMEYGYGYGSYQQQSQYRDDDEEDWEEMD